MYRSPHLYRFEGQVKEQLCRLSQQMDLSTADTVSIALQLLEQVANEVKCGGRIIVKHDHGIKELLVHDWFEQPF